MAKIFNNINKTLYPAEGNLNLSGWGRTMAYDTNRVPHITDTVGSGIALSKMGTSIPTPFARIFLFKTAFEMVNGSAYGANDNSAYGKLVSECLDFLEFIYGYGDAIVVKPWNVDLNITALRNSASAGHQVLGRSLENFALNLGVEDIYLFYYNGVLIGGTSPFTLVYTSPNWQRVKNITNACGLAGNQLFPDYSLPNTVATPLHERDLGFRTMLTRYYVAFRNVPGMSDTSFFKYIYRNQNIYDAEMRQYFADITGVTPYDVAMFRNDYACVKANMTEIDILGMGGASTLFLATKSNGVPPGGKKIIGGGTEDGTNISDDYKIAATVNNGNVSRPLVLFEGGITGATYVAGKPLPNGVDIVRNPDEPLDSRILPGGQNIKYPYLTDTDFIQEKIIKVGYKVDTDNFMTFGIKTDGDGDYLLPLRKEIFEYFKPSDFVDGNVQGLSIKLEELNKETVQVHLRIPVQFKGRPYVELVHKYEKDDIVVLKSHPDIFSIGVFPSYKVCNSQVPNLYSVLVLDARNKVTTKYYAFNNGVVDVEVTSSKKRMKNGSRYEEIRQAFNICEVEVDDAKALLLPNFKEVTPDGSSKVVVGVDFGTTNTYICYSTKNGAEPHSLEISQKDMQVLMLNKIDLSKGNYGEAYKNSMLMMPPYIQSLDREFAPLLLGSESDVAYPFRTVTCETEEGSDCFKKIPDFQLFADINVGFNFLKEIVKLQNEKYNTNIKWDIEKPRKIGSDDKEVQVCINRVRAYCMQTAWMIKNKLMLLHDPCTKFTVFLTFPYTMKRPVRNDIVKYWQNAFDVVMGIGNVSINRVTESIAPYYSMVSKGGNFTDNALNIDIGGGTTDMLFADVENNVFYYTSSKFAGNDIWGDGKQKVEVENVKDNGFVKDFEEKLKSNAIIVSTEGKDNPKDAYLQYKALVGNSADLMSYIFRYEDKYRYTDFIRLSKTKFVPILCVHLGALLYHVAQVLTEKNITIPSTITFSGMGAKYIHIISIEDEDIQDIVKLLLSSFMTSMSKDGKCKMPNNFTVIFQENAKEVTAQGAMLVKHESLEDISSYTETPLCIYGVGEDVPKLTYEKVVGYRDNVIKNFEKFIKDFLYNDDIVSFFKEEFEIEFNEDLIGTLRNEAVQSFNLMSDNNKTDIVNETMFFWPLKNGLYKASKNKEK